MESNNRTEGESLAPRTPVPQTLEGQSSGSGNAQATSSSANPAMFDSATNVMINDGHFTNQHGNYANVSINVNSGAQVRIQNQPSAQNVAPSPNPNPNRNRRRRRPNRPEAIRPVQRSNEMYQRHLMLKDRGLPLWIPQPNIRLPIPYRAKGVCIGDVGIVTSFGDFDFLFNICRTRDDPINPEELPDNFDPIYPSLNPIDIREFREFSSGSYLASSTIVESQTGEQSSGLTFESSASEGAILTMPDGAFHEELSNLSTFRNYVAVHAENWYKFVNGPRGREAQNGDVRVVVGCDKTTSWGMAVFANTSSAQQSNFRLKFRPLQGQHQSQHNAGTAYAWEHSGVAEARVGPEPGENDELGETPAHQLRNQCLFMRTLSVTLPESLWAETFPGTVSAINQEGSQPEYQLRPPNLNTSSSSSNPARSIQGRRRSPGPSDSEITEEENKDDEESSILIRDGEVRMWPELGENEELRLRSQALFMRTVASFSASHSGYLQYLPPNPNTSSLSNPAIQGRLIQKLPWSSAVEKESVPSSPGDPVGSADPSDTHGPKEPFVGFVDKLYHMTNDPVLAKYIRWTNSGTSFIVIVIVQMFAELLEPLFRHNNFSGFVRQLNMYGFQAISRISPLNQEQTWEFCHPKFMRDRPDLLHEIKRKWNSTLKDEVELPGDLVQAPAQLDAMQNETTRLWVNTSKIINKYLLDQVPDAKIALTHDRDWSHVAVMGLSPSELIEEITLVNDITVDSVSGVVFFEPKNEISLVTVEEQSIIDQMEGGQITLEQYLFGSSENHSMLLHNLINELRSDYMPFCDQYTMPAKEIPNFLMGHPKRLLSLDDLVDIRLANFQSLLEHHCIHRLRSQLSALPPDDPDKGTWLLRLADVLSRRFWQLNQKDDLEEAIWYYQEALSLLPQTDYHFLEAILGFCSSIYQRFQLLGHLDDLKKLLSHLHTEHNLNLESLLTPVKAQLQPRSQQLTDKFSTTHHSSFSPNIPKSLPPLAMLNVPKASSNLDEEEAEEAAVLEEPVKDFSAPAGSRDAVTKLASKIWKRNSPGSAGDLEPRRGRSCSLWPSDFFTSFPSETSNPYVFNTQHHPAQSTYAEFTVPLTPVQHAHKMDTSLSSMPSPPFEAQPSTYEQYVDLYNITRQSAIQSQSPAYSGQDFDQKISQASTLSLQDFQSSSSIDSDFFPQCDPAAFEAIESSSTSPTTTERSFSFPMETSSGKMGDYMQHDRTGDLLSLLNKKKRQPKPLPDPPAIFQPGLNNSSPSYLDFSAVENFQSDPLSFYNAAVSAQITPITTGQQGHSSYNSRNSFSLKECKNDTLDFQDPEHEI